MNRKNLFLAGALTACTFQPAQAGLILSQWIGPNEGNWSVAASWSPASVPNNHDDIQYAVTIDNGSIVFLNQNTTISTLSVAAGNQLTINNSRRLEVSASDRGGIINNAGVIRIDAGASSTYLQPVGGLVSLTGGGTIELSDSPNNWIYRADASGSLVNVDNIIRGSGHLSWSSVPTSITNYALIIADQPTPLEVHPSSALFTNRGTMRAELGGTMRLTGGAYDNDQSVIEALADSTVELNGNAIITGGVLDTSDTGVIVVTGSTPRLVNLTQSGWLRINNSRNLHIEGVIHNTGTIELDGDQSSTYLQPVGGLVSLTGGGTILMSDSANNWIYRGDATGALLNVDNTIRGSGHLSWSSTPTPITNHALIIADQPTRLEVHPNSALFTNTGTMQAANGGTLRLNGGEYLNVDGVIEALAGSTVELNGNAIITGGVLDTADTGVIAVTNSTPRLVDLTQAGLLTINNNRTLQLEGVIHNTGTIQINANQSSTNLRLVGAVTLTGSGTIELSDSPNNSIYRADAIGSLVNVDNTIRGSGNLGSNNVPTDILNQGTIIADGNVALAIRGHSANGFRNEGFVEASGVGGITSSGANFTNAGQVLVNSSSSFTRVGNLTQTAGSTTVNGVLAVSSGSLLVQGGALKGSGQVSGQVNNTGGVVEPGASIGTLTINGSYTQTSDGALHIELGGGSARSNGHDQLVISGNASLDGALQLSLINTCKLAVGQEFVVLTSNALTGKFSAVEGPAGLHVIYDNQSVTVKVVEEICPADVSCDGLVNVDDLLAVIGTWGACADVPCSSTCVTDIAPPGGDCVVDVNDLLMVIANWGACQ